MHANVCVQYTLPTERERILRERISSLMKLFLVFLGVQSIVALQIFASELQIKNRNFTNGKNTINTSILRSSVNSRTIHCLQFAHAK